MYAIELRAFTDEFKALFLKSNPIINDFCWVLGDDELWLSYKGSEFIAGGSWPLVENWTEKALTS